MSSSEHITFKVCSKCGEEKSTSEFYKRKGTNDGLYSHCKVCHSVMGAAYRAAHKEKIAATNAAYRAAHKEKIAAYGAEWYAANREKILVQKAEYYLANREKHAAQMAEWYKANKEKHDARSAEWRKANPEKRAAHQAAWQKANPEKGAAKTRNYLARKKNAPGLHTAEDIQAQHERQDGKCYWCESKVGEDYHVDHIIPLSKGGSNWPSNLVITCPTCNTSKSGKHPMDYAGIMF